jgi:quinol monooxygenase YgiN
VIQRKAEITARSDVIVIASAKAKPWNGKDFERALRDGAEPTRAQPGRVLFSLYRSVENPLTIIGFERRSRREDHQRHLQGGHVQKPCSLWPSYSQSHRKSPPMKSWTRNSRTQVRQFLAPKVV